MCPACVHLAPRVPRMHPACAPGCPGCVQHSRTMRPWCAQGAQDVCSMRPGCAQHAPRMRLACAQGAQDAPRLRPFSPRCVQHAPRMFAILAGHLFMRTGVGYAYPQKRRSLSVRVWTYAYGGGFLCVRGRMISYRLRVRDMRYMIRYMIRYVIRYVMRRVI